MQLNRKLKRLARAVVAALALYALVLRPKQLGWGATTADVGKEMPGDDILGNANLVSTRAITIHRPAHDVWPWIAQLGQARGGFYSYDALENLVGCRIHSATGIVPEWQELRAGDKVHLAPNFGLDVAVVEVDHVLVLRGAVPMGDTPPPYDFCWTFELEQATNGKTRLLVRERYRYTRWWAPLLVEPVELISFVMSQKMLRGIKERAEKPVNT